MNNLKIFLSFCWIIIYFSFSIITFPTITAAENNTIKIGYIDYTGFIDKKPDGSYSGYGVDYLTQISRSTGWKYEFIYDSWDTQLKNLKEGSIDFLCHAQITPERQKNYLFSKNSIGYEHNIVYAALNSNYYYNDYQNLISNASKFTPAGGKIRFEITEKAYKKQTIFIRIIVSDTGIGMTPEMLTRLFNTFEQENANTAQQYGGSGLGLSIVKNLVELMHGSISVESKKGIGSMFTVDLPFSIPKIDELSSSKSINDLRVLVVDNDCASRIYMTSILDRINVQYDIATTTEQTVKMLSTADKAGKHYDICFIDCKASFADSITLTKNIRKIYDKKALVIILSAYDISEIGENMETSGADIFLQKPLFQSTVFNMLISLTDKNYIKGTFHKESYDFHGKKVLLAEDNALNTEIAIELLNSVNLNVDHAENGQIAVDKFLTAPIGTYDIILMDIQMPVMNGYQATKTIRSSSHPNAKSIPIFAMTADAFTENVAEALSAGMNGHIAKPIDTHILYRTLCNCLRQA